MATHKLTLLAMASAVVFSTGALAADVSDDFITQQHQKLSQSSAEKGFGPQAPRDLTTSGGSNTRLFQPAPHYSRMNLCDIHFHNNAEHKAGEFTTYAGNADGQGNGGGFKWNGQLSGAEAKPLAKEVCVGKHGGLQVGDTIEVHYVHSSAQATLGPTLGTCLSESVMNPQLRVEAQTYVLVNDDSALDFMKLTEIANVNGYNQAVNIPNNTGTPIEYAGSTTGPKYNEAASPLQVSWSVRPQVVKVNAKTVGQWCENNVFKEDHAHGVRNLVIDPALLSPM